MDTERTSPTRASELRYVIFAGAAVVVIAAVLLGVTQFSTSALPLVAPNYRCVPQSQIPQLKPGDHATLTASYGGFTATFHSSVPSTSTSGGLDVGTPFQGTLKITDGAQDWTLPPPTNAGASQINDFCVIAFNRVRHPGVMVEGFTGGAHCCEAPVIYLFDSSKNRYVKVVDLSPNHPKSAYIFDHNSGFFPMVVGRHVLLRSGDDSFAYAFGCYACSALPIVLYYVDLDGLSDVTPEHASIVAEDAARTWKVAAAAVKAEDGVGVNMAFPAPFGYLAPWVADECSMGRGAQAWPTIERLQSEGKLSDALYHQATQNPGSFATTLRFVLLKDGYCTGQI